MKLKINNLSSNTINVIRNSVNSLIIKGGALIVALFTMPAYMQYFNDDAVLGVWFTLLALLSWIFYFDMGLGNGLRNKLVVCIEKSDVEEGKRYISSAYIFLTGITLVLGVLMLALIQFLDWNLILNIPDSRLTNNILIQAVQICLLGILLQFILRLISSILFAMQKSFIPNLLTLLSNILLLIIVVYCNYTGNNNNIVVLSWIYLLTVNLPLLIATILVFNFSLRDYKPSLKYFDRRASKNILKTGGAFLALQVLAMIIGSSFVTYLVSIFVGPENVVEYNVYYRIYSQIYTIFTIIMIPLWSAVTQAMYQNNFQWIVKSVNTLRLVVFGLFVSQFMMIPFMQWFFDLWLGNDSIKVEIEIQLVFSINTGVIMFQALTAQICNGLNELRVQVKWMITAALLIIPLSLIGTHFHQHFTMVLIAQSIAMLPYCIFQTIWLEKYLKMRIIKHATD